MITFTGTPHKANVFDIPLLQRLNSLLDQVEEQLPCSLVCTGSGKFFSAGFDLQALTGTAHGKGGKNDGGKTPQGQELVNYSWQVLARLLIFPAPTFCLFNGHAFGLGLFIGLACDHRIMLAQGGYLCLPEITIGLPLGSGFAALAKCKMDPGTLRTSALTGKKFSYKEALKAGMIDAVVSPSADTDTPVPQQVLDMAEQVVSTSTKGNLSEIKKELYQETRAVLLGQTNRSKL